VSTIAPIQAPPIDLLGKTEQTKSASSVDELGKPFKAAFEQARDTQADATEAAEKFAAGDPKMGIHEVMISTEKANISLRYATTLKNKAIEAYRELMNTQV